MERRKSKKRPKLSPYTHAKYCADITDCRDGVSEINEAIRYRENRNVPYYYWVRLGKLKDKIKKYGNQAKDESGL
jgi:hypothetical protein